MEKAKGLADKVEAAPFRVTLNHVQTWEDPFPLVLLGEEGVTGAELLYGAIHKALIKGSMAPRREAGITPHISLLRDPIAVAKEFVEPISWKVQEFVMLDSVGGEGRHEVLGRWALAA